MSDTSILERFIAAIMLVASFPIFLIVCALIYFIDGHKFFLFRQNRVGFQQRIFICYKFRTMSIDTLDGPSHVVGMANTTKFGTMLRRYKIDELPQLLNIAAGDMKFVGPRPGLPGHKELILARESLGVFSVYPGVTGLSQVKKIDMSDPVKLALCDQEYINKRSLALDIKIIFRTITGHGAGDAAKK